MKLHLNKKIRGYNNLTDLDKKVFNNFQNEFLKVNDGEIKFISVVRKTNYIKINFHINGCTEWLHVTPYGWY